ncbi:siderophore-iron reductase FhuF [Pseudomonas sp.]|uniref:siderophore-iron reductase FhuF n=1 Tax=Pseudomonas sp. TaxID=306 RepID=UPI003CC5C971
MIAAFASAFPGPLAGVGESLTLAQDDEPSIVLSDLLDPQRYQAPLAAFAQRYPDGDFKALVSLWTQWYFSVLVPPVVILDLLQDRLLPLDLNHTHLRLDAAGNPERVELDHPGQVRTPRSAFERFAPLVFEHLAPLCATLAQFSGLSPRVLWSNAGVRVAWAVGVVARHPLGGAERAAPGRELLGAKQWPNGGSNPLFEPVRFAVPDDETSTSTRRVCCLRYRLDSLDYCNSCPLPINRRQCKKR